jgi:hypothetical protein
VKSRVAVVGVVLVGALWALTGTAAAISGSGSATACISKSRHVEGGILVSLTKENVDPSQKRFATCAYAAKVARQVTSRRLEEPATVAGFRCFPFALSRKPAKFRYSCQFRGADTATEIHLSFTVVYAEG